jgi:hypothetical protein
MAGSTLGDQSRYMPDLRFRICGHIVVTRVRVRISALGLIGRMMTAHDLLTLQTAFTANSR